jgi:hypothetical protein
MSRSNYVCTRCSQFSTSVAVQSGHNRWSKIKHDKAGVDKKKNQERSIFSRDIELASKRESSAGLIFKTSTIC